MTVRLVVAEDESLIRMDLVEMLRAQGYDVVGQATDGVEAVRLCAELAPDAALLDVKMPLLDGISAAEQIDAPVVLLTAFSERELVDRATEAGVHAYIVKPFSAAALRPAIEVARSRHQEAVALATEIADVSARLDARKLIDRAKAKLMAQHGLTEADAFHWLQKLAMDRRLGMAEVARTLLAPSSDHPP